MENKNSTKHPSAYKIISIVVIVILAILFTFPLDYTSVSLKLILMKGLSVWWFVLLFVFYFVSFC